MAGRPKKPPSPKQMLKEVLPIEDIFNKDEVILYNKLVDVYLDDFDVNDLTSSDMDDILDLAKNRVLEFRLLKGSKDDEDRQIDIATTIEKLSKKNEKIKESLVSRRKDRIDPNEFKGFSIVDLAVAYDLDVKRKHSDKLRRLREKEQKMLDSREGYDGNRYDIMEQDEREDEQ